MRGSSAASDGVQSTSVQNEGVSASLFIMDKWYVAARLSEVATRSEKTFKVCGRDIVFARTSNRVCTAHDAATGAEVPCAINEDLIWVFIASDESRHADPGPVPDFGGPKGKVRFMEKVTIPAHQDDAVYGLLDPAHTPFVHRSPLWRGNGILKEKSKSFEPSHFGFTMMPHAPVNSDIYHLIGGAISVRIAFSLPGLRAEYIQNKKHCVLGLTALTPIDEQHTTLRQIFYWDTPILGAIRPFATLFARPFLNQDVNIMALRQKNLGYRGKGMLIGDSDRQFLWYLSLKKAWDASGRCRKSFENPLSPATLRWKT